MRDQRATAVKACRLCQHLTLNSVLSLGEQYVPDFLTAEGHAVRAPLELVRCQSCGLIQLRHTFSRASLYKHYWYRSGISSTMRQALSDLVSRTCEIVNLNTDDLVLDIGCNDGTLLRSYSTDGLY